jgi:hypothetical protein
MNVLYQSHLNRKRQQAETFSKEVEQLEAERLKKHHDLKIKMDNENEEFEKSGNQRLNKLNEMQKIIVEKFDKDCFDSYGIQSPQTNNRYSVYNLMGSPNSVSNNQFGNMTNPQLSYFRSTNEMDLNGSPNSSKLKSSASCVSNSKNSDKAAFYINESSSTNSSVLSSSSASNPSHSNVYYYQANQNDKTSQNESNNNQNVYQYQFQPNQSQFSHKTSNASVFDINQSQLQHLQQQPHQNIIYSIDPYLSHLNNTANVNSTSLSYTTASSSAQNSNRRNSTAFS